MIATMGNTADIQLPSRQYCRLGQPAESDQWLTPARQRQWLLALLILGIVARVVRYALRFPLWEDECNLVANYLDADYLSVLRPLKYDTVCPMLFSWVELTAVRLLGFNEYSLRLFPLLCSLGSLVLFVHIARKLTTGNTLLLSVGLFAVSYPIVRYVAEAKQYGCDLLVSSVSMALLIQFWHRPEQRRWLWALALWAPVSIGFSYPAVFVAGAISPLLAWSIWRSGQFRAWPAWVAYNLSVAVGFGVVYLVSIRPMLQGQLSTMRVYWQEAFPPIAEPWKLPGWLLEVHAGSMLAYPIGGPGYGSTLTLLCCLAAIILLWKRRNVLLLGLTLGPLALHFVAAAMRRYPYGEHMRMALYLAPMFCILAAIGWQAILYALNRRRPSAVGMHITLAALAMIAVVSIVRDFCWPYKSANDLRAKSFACWFWFNMPHSGELVCLHTDLGVDLEPAVFRVGRSAVYLCNQRIYSPRHAQRRQPQWEAVSEHWPLRCVQFRSPEVQRDDQAINRWLEQMQQRYRLIGRQSYPFPFYNKWETELRFVDTVEVYEFVPREPARQTRSAISAAEMIR